MNRGVFSPSRNVTRVVVVVKSRPGCAEPPLVLTLTVIAPRDPRERVRSSGSREPSSAVNAVALELDAARSAARAGRTGAADGSFGFGSRKRGLPRGSDREP